MTFRKWPGNAHTTGSKQDKLLMRKGKRTWYQFHALTIRIETLAALDRKYYGRMFFSGSGERLS